MNRVSLSLLLAALLPLSAVAVTPPRADIPEVGFQIRDSAYFFKLKNPKDFKVARPDSFGDLSAFKTADLFYTVNAPSGTVWQKYLKTNPLKIWSTNRAMITAAYVPSLDRVLYRKDMETTEWPGFEVGMKIFVDMASLPVAVSNKPAIMVGLQIMRLDEASRTVEFRYLEGTPSYGRQTIEFRPSAANPNVVEIDHKTWFRSYGAAIEKLYPMYHKKMIDQMHARFRHEIEGDRKP
jgi:hypothetical protein